MNRLLYFFNTIESIVKNHLIFGKLVITGAGCFQGPSNSEKMMDVALIEAGALRICLKRTEWLEIFSFSGIAAYEESKQSKTQIVNFKVDRGHICSIKLQNFVETINGPVVGQSSSKSLPRVPFKFNLTSFDVIILCGFP